MMSSMDEDFEASDTKEWEVQVGLLRHAAKNVRSVADAIDYDEADIGMHKHGLINISTALNKHARGLEKGADLIEQYHEEVKDDQTNDD